jgi:hypothetical protein
VLRSLPPLALPAIAAGLEQHGIEFGQQGSQGRLGGIAAGRQAGDVGIQLRQLALGVLRRG